VVIFLYFTVLTSGTPVDQKANHASLALGIIKAVFKVLMPGTSTRVEGLADLADYAFSQEERWVERNDFRRDLEAAVDRLTRKFSKITSSEIRQTDTREREIAIEVVGKAILDSNLTKADLEFNKLLNRENIFRSLEPMCVRAWRKEDLSEGAIQYGRILLAAACDYLINLTRSLPEFNDEITWQTYIATRGLSDNLESAIESVILPRFRSGTPQEVSEFEAKYATDIVTSLGSMEIFGLDLPTELQRQPLNIAYITLTVSADARESARFDAVLAHLLAAATRAAETDIDAQGKVDREYARWRTGSTTAFDLSTGRLHGSPGSQKSNKVRRPIHILITGEAGSGKTTVARWLAVQIAAGTLPQRLSMLSSDLPLFIPLRHVLRGARINPGEDDLTNYVSSGRSSSIPGEWLRGRLRTGQALLIFDGLDELSDDNRTRAMVWIQSLMNDYPACDFIATARPDGYDPRWFDDHGFTNVHLQPMNLADIRNCISGWFRALHQGIPNSKWDRYENSKKALLADIETRASVRDLAESPLLCAMLCAFYTLQIKAAPRSRGELYRRVIEALVGRDTAKRAAADVEAQKFDLPQKLSLLQAVAREMVQTHSNEIYVHRDPEMSFVSKPTVYHVMQERLGGMPTARVTADQAVRYLTKRSVVFRLIGPNLAQFAHRTFQEYLAARDFALSGHSDELFKHVADREWHQIFAFAASAAPADIASRLVDKILDTVSPKDTAARERLMLVAECLSAAAPGVSPRVADRARAQIERLLPPRTDDEAVLVAAFGEGILPWLEVDERNPVEISEKCVRTAALIGGPDALDLIARYSTSAYSRELEEILITEWHRFPAQDYAIKVLSNCQLASPLKIDQRSTLEAVRLLPQARQIQIKARDGLGDFRSWASLGMLRELDLGGLPSLASLSGISALTNLRKLGLNGIPATEGFDELGMLRNLTELYINQCAGLTDPVPFGSLSTLRALHMAGCMNVRDFAWLSQLAQLWNLDLSATNASDLSSCAHLTMLRKLRAKVSQGVAGLLDLSNASYLRELTLNIGRSLEWVAPSSGALQTIVLAGQVTDSDLTVLAAIPSLRSLSIEDGSRLTNLESLACQTSLRHLAISRLSSSANVGSLDRLRELRSLKLVDSGIENLHFIGEMPQLNNLVADGCHALQDISALSNVKTLKYVSLQNGTYQIDETLLTSIAEQVGFLFDFDPVDPLGYETG
jgi:Leucine-rich repeat (LRR) protein